MKVLSKGVRWKAALFLTFFVLRITLIPNHLDVSNWFSHDSAYLVEAANNFLMGQGLVNHAHWLLLTPTETLPVPLRFSNPLYPVSMAAWHWLTGLPLTWVGAMLSLASWMAIGCYSYRIGKHWTGSEAGALLVAAGACLLPPVLESSLHILPDMMCAAMAMAGLDLLLPHRKEQSNWLHYAGAGLCFGLAWQVRASVMMLLPAVGLLLVLNKQKTGAAVFLLAMTLTCAPWLLRNRQVTGELFPKENTMAMMQDYWAMKYGIQADQFWRSQKPYEGLVTAFLQSPVEITRFYLRGMVLEARMLAGALTNWNNWQLLLLLPGLLWSIYKLGKRYWREPLFWVPGVAAVTLYGALAMKGGSVEGRYFLAVWIELGAILGWGCHEALRQRHRWELALFAGAAMVILIQTAQVQVQARRVRPELVGIRDDAQRIASLDPEQGPVTHYLPYFYTYYTNRPAISPLYAKAQQSRDFQKRRGSHLLVLPKGDEQRYFEDADREWKNEFMEFEISSRVWVGKLKH